MANEVHVALLKQGVEAWNAWRKLNPYTRPDLSDANLSGADLSKVDLSEAHLTRADLTWANLTWADLGGAYLIEANFAGASLNRANLSGATLNKAKLKKSSLKGARLFRTNLSDANLSGADLGGADLSKADLSNADLSKTLLAETVFGNTELKGAKGLESCRHSGPSTIDHRTLTRSGPIPLAFLRGCGLPDNLIDYLPSMFEQAIQFYSCFISYSSKDAEFARRLYADLQDSGVRCWFAPEDLKIGDPLHRTINTAIRIRDKLLLILSEGSVASAWVTNEVETALEEEEKHDKIALFPVRLDDAVFNTTDQWAYDIKRSRHIGDFTRWKEHDPYKRSLERLLRDLKVVQEGQAGDS